MIQIVAPRYWFALAAVGVLLLGLVGWSIFGRLETTVPGQGVLLTGGAVHEVHTAQAGVVESFAVGVGDSVAAGGTVASIMLADGSTSAVTSATAGVVNSTQAVLGQGLEAGQVVLTLADPSQPLEVAGTVAATSANQVEVGGEVRVVPIGSNSTGLETLPARVIAISSLPVSAAELSAQLGSDALATQLIDAGGGSVKSVTLAFDDVTSTADGFVVTNSHGDQTTVRFGTQVTISIVTASEAPIDKVLK